MDKQSIVELQTLVSKQKEQLTRYENRLRDLLTAYKGLFKEKEALEITLATFSKNVNETKSSDVLKKTDNTKATEGEEHSVCNNKIKQLEIQLATGLNSLATLSAEKSRMEASFQADKNN
ncbi:uncharacterized protein LOC113373792 [Ctenocephalides felis]|uniref:uncharacterized protein LOC113373792 n=1 Tax=Ctenocephalides felis TaxID=7515 RepID=UPI000E6E24AB|nr:uncharacterized protein LOC113373792 [Ctenocephalides felis]